MRKFHIIGLVFAAVFAFGAMTAASAFAAIEWLENGKVIAVAQPATSEGLLELTDLGVGVTVDCEGLLDGTVGPGAADVINAVLNAANELINELGEAPELGISCEVTKGSVITCAVGTLATVWPENMYNANGPWLSVLELMEPETGHVLWLDLLHTASAEKSKQPGYEIRCSNGIEDLCVGETSADVTNEATDVLGVFSEAEEEAENLLADCSVGGANKGGIAGSGLTLLNGGATLAVSDS